MGYLFNQVDLIRGTSLTCTFHHIGEKIKKAGPFLRTPGRGRDHSTCLYLNVLGFMVEPILENLLS